PSWAAPPRPQREQARRRPPSSTAELLAVLELGLQIVGVHHGDEVDRDRLRARGLALAVVRARAEVLVHRLDHQLDALVALRLPLREQVEMAHLGRREQARGAVRARCDTGAAPDALGG